ncbi:MAG: hypothetical protein KTR21_06690 [Rhodobacteraceae bacterium]|nr:hypothetical protein [Paracoccaceae bacterium]
MRHTMLVAVALIASSAAAPATAQAPETGCDLAFEAEIHFNGEDAAPHRLTTTFEGPDCLNVGVLWRIHAPDGALIWAEVTTLDDLAPPGIGGDKPETREGVALVYKGKAGPPQAAFSMADHTQWPLDQKEADRFEFEDEDGLWSETETHREDWNAGIQEGRRAWCWHPGTHWARCFWLDPATGLLRPAYVSAW